MLIDEAVEVLVEEEEAGAYEGRVREVQLTLGHVCDLHRQTRRGKRSTDTHERSDQTRNTRNNSKQATPHECNSESP